MKKDTHKKVTRALIAGLFVTNLPIPMAHAGVFEEGKQTLTPPSPTSDDVSEAGAGGGETGAVAASERLVKPCPRSLQRPQQVLQKRPL